MGNWWHTVDGWKKSGINSPVEGKVVYSILCRVFYTSQVGWERDFCTINSSFDVYLFLFKASNLET